MLNLVQSTSLIDAHRVTAENHLVVELPFHLFIKVVTDMKTTFFMNFQKAFSLVELMVVIAIIGILSAIAVPSYKNYVTRAKVVEMISITDNIQSIIAQQYSLGNTTWTDFATLGATAPTSTYVTATFVSSTIGQASCTALSAGSTLVGSIGVQGAATNLGLPSGALNIAEVGCVLNDIIKWYCGPTIGATLTPAASLAANSVYLPTSCTTTFTTAP